MKHNRALSLDIDPKNPIQSIEDAFVKAGFDGLAGVSGRIMEEMGFDDEIANAEAFDANISEHRAKYVDAVMRVNDFAKKIRELSGEYSEVASKNRPKELDKGRISSITEAILGVFSEYKQAVDTVKFHESIVRSLVAAKGDKLG